MRYAKNIIAIFVILASLVFATNYHGSAIKMSGTNNWKGWVVAIDTGLILHTPDRGLNWVNQSFFTSRYFFDVYFRDTLHGWIGTDQGFIYYTDDGGANWSTQVMGISKFTTRITFFDDNYGWASLGGAMVGQTNNGGQQWNQIPLYNPPFNVDTVDSYDISFATRMKGWFCAGRYPEYIESLPGQGDTWFTKGQGYIALSNDTGLTWQLQRRDTVYDYFGIRFVDTLKGFVVGGNDRTNSGIVMKSINSGQTWQTITIPNQTKYLRALEFVGKKYAWAVGRNGTIIHSSDSGNTWVQQQSNVDTTLFDVDFDDSLHGLVAGNGCVLYTDNGGNTWQQANIGIQEINYITNVNPKLIITVSPNPFRHQALFNIKSTNVLKYNIKIYNLNGELIKSFDQNQPPIWDGTDNKGKQVASGVYFGAININQRTTIIPLVYQK
jgi:photosystem II stability/assembly factor-like uncharacterized protein